MTFDTAVDGGNNGGTTNTLSWTHNNSGNFVNVSFAGDVIGAFDDITSVTYNGVAMTLVQKLTTAAGSGQRYGYQYILPNAPTGSHTVAITCTNIHLLQGGSASYATASTTGQPDNQTTNSATGTSCTTALTTIADNAWVVLFEGGYNSGNMPVAGAGATLRIADAVNGSWGIFDSNGPKTPAGSYSMTTTRSSDPFLLGITHMVFSIAPVAAGGGPTEVQLERGTRGMARGMARGMV